MINYFKRWDIVDNIRRMLKILDGSDKYPRLVFEYSLKDDILKLVFPSKEKYMFSFLAEELTIEYHKKTGNLLIQPDRYNLTSHFSGKRLAFTLKNYIKKFEQREAFINMIVQERKRMSAFIDPRHRYSSEWVDHRSGSSNKSYNDDNCSVYRDIVYSASDSCSHSDSSNSNHSHNGNNSDN